MIGRLVGQGQETRQVQDFLLPGCSGGTRAEPRGTKDRGADGDLAQRRPQRQAEQGDGAEGGGAANLRLGNISVLRTRPRALPGGEDHRGGGEGGGLPGGEGQGGGGPRELAAHYWQWRREGFSQHQHFMLPRPGPQLQSL